MKPVFWYQGLFLQPHHFQVQERFLRSLLDPLLTYQVPAFWGVRGLGIAEGALRNQSFEVERGEFLFPDGSHVLVPGNGALRPRDFRKAWTEPERPFKVYLGLRRWDPAAGNVSLVDRPEDLGGVATRFAADVNPAETPDLYQGGASASVRTMSYALKLVWESERADMGDYLVMPLALLEQDRGEIRLSQRFSPPAFVLGGSDTLLQCVKAIREMVAAHVRHLEEYKLAPDQQDPQFFATYAHYLMALRVLAGHLPTLHHVTEPPHGHPWQVYGILRRLVGELSTFTDRVNALGRLADGRSLLPEYDHEDPLAAFEAARLLIVELLDAIVVGPQRIIDLARDGNAFQGAIPHDAFDPRHVFFLSVRTSAPRAKALDELLQIAKLGSRSQIPVLLARALSGVPLDYSAAPPAGLPKHPGALHFRLDMSHPQWLEIQRSQTACLHWDGAPPDTKAELVILRR